MAEYIANRDQIIEFLQEELVGPSLKGEPIDCSKEVKFSSNEEFYRPWKQDNGEEILQRDPPLVRYGVGVLYPLGKKIENEEHNNKSNEDDSLNLTDEELNESDSLIPEEVKENIEKIKEEISCYAFKLGFLKARPLTARLVSYQNKCVTA